MRVLRSWDTFSAFSVGFCIWWYLPEKVPIEFVRNLCVVGGGVVLFSLCSFFIGLSIILFCSNREYQTWKSSKNLLETLLTHYRIIFRALYLSLIVSTWIGVELTFRMTQGVQEIIFWYLLVFSMFFIYSMQAWFTGLQELFYWVRSQVQYQTTFPQPNTERSSSDNSSNSKIKKSIH